MPGDSVPEHCGASRRAGLGVPAKNGRETTLIPPRPPQPRPFKDPGSRSVSSPCRSDFVTSAALSASMASTRRAAAARVQSEDQATAAAKSRAFAHAAAVNTARQVSGTTPGYVSYRVTAAPVAAARTQPRGSNQTVSSSPVFAGPVRPRRLGSTRMKHSERISSVSSSALDAANAVSAMWAAPECSSQSVSSLDRRSWHATDHSHALSAASLAQTIPRKKNASGASTPRLESSGFPREARKRSSSSAAQAAFAAPACQSLHPISQICQPSFSEGLSLAAQSAMSVSSRSSEPEISINISRRHSSAQASAAARASHMRPIEVAPRESASVKLVQSLSNALRRDSKSKISLDDQLDDHILRQAAHVSAAQLAAADGLKARWSKPNVNKSAPPALMAALRAGARHDAASDRSCGQEESYLQSPSIWQSSRGVEENAALEASTNATKLVGSYESSQVPVGPNFIARAAAAAIPGTTQAYTGPSSISSYNGARAAAAASVAWIPSNRILSPTPSMRSSPETTQYKALKAATAASAPQQATSTQFFEPSGAQVPTGAKSSKYSLSPAPSNSFAHQASYMAATTSGADHNRVKSEDLARQQTLQIERRAAQLSSNALDFPAISTSHQTHPAPLLSGPALAAALMAVPKAETQVANIEHRIPLGRARRYRPAAQWSGQTSDFGLESRDKTALSAARTSAAHVKSASQLRPPSQRIVTPTPTVLTTSSDHTRHESSSATAPSLYTQASGRSDVASASSVLSKGSRDEHTFGEKPRHPPLIRQQSAHTSVSYQATAASVASSMHPTIVKSDFSPVYRTFSANSDYSKSSDNSLPLLKGLEFPDSPKNDRDERKTELLTFLGLKRYRKKLAEKEGKPQKITPKPAHSLMTTMRSKSGKKQFNEEKPWKHHSESFLTVKERKRYDGVWASNRGTHLPYMMQVVGQGLSNGQSISNLVNEEQTYKIPDSPYQTSSELADVASEILNSPEDGSRSSSSSIQQYIHQQTQVVHGYIVARLWRRSSLSDEILSRIWTLVDTSHDGTLDHASFDVGMWLVDQCLYGRKLPNKVDDKVWQSVSHLHLKVRVHRNAHGRLGTAQVGKKLLHTHIP